MFRCAVVGCRCCRFIIITIITIGAWLSTTVSNVTLTSAPLQSLSFSEHISLILILHYVLPFKLQAKKNKKISTKPAPSLWSNNNTQFYNRPTTTIRYRNAIGRQAASLCSKPPNKPTHGTASPESLEFYECSRYLHTRWTFDYMQLSHSRIYNLVLLFVSSSSSSVQLHCQSPRAQGYTLSYNLFRILRKKKQLWVCVCSRVVHSNLVQILKAINVFHFFCLHFSLLQSGTALAL